MTLQQLESHLWEAANILRGPVDAADFKTYVFPLLFFKRLSDVHDEEYDAALAESDGDEEYALFPQNYRFQVPGGCHWRDVRAVTTNVGQALQKALRGIERANPDTLYGIFGDAQWTNKERLSDALLRDLVEHFSHISLANQARPAHRVLCREGGVSGTGEPACRQTTLEGATVHAQEPQRISGNVTLSHHVRSIVAVDPASFAKSGVDVLQLCPGSCPEWWALPVDTT